MKVEAIWQASDSCLSKEIHVQNDSITATTAATATCTSLSDRPDTVHSKLWVWWHLPIGRGYEVETPSSKYLEVVVSALSRTGRGKSKCKKVFLSLSSERKLKSFVSRHFVRSTKVKWVREEKKKKKSGRENRESSTSSTSLLSSSLDQNGSTSLLRRSFHLRQRRHRQKSLKLFKVKESDASDAAKMDHRSLSPYVFRPIPDAVEESGTRSRVCSGDGFDRFSSQIVSSPTSRAVNPKLLSCYKLSQETWSSTGSRHSSRPGKI